MASRAIFLSTRSAVKNSPTSKPVNPKDGVSAQELRLIGFFELTDFPGVKPARYRGRFHWITIVEVRRFPTSYLTELVGWSYQKALASLSKAKQIAIRTSQNKI